MRQNHLLKVSIHLFKKKILPAGDNFPGKIEDTLGKSKASVWRNLSTGRVPRILAVQSQFTIHIFFQNSRFTKIIRHKILMKHCCFSHGCLPDKTAFKTVTRSISMIIIMAVQNFNIDKSMVTCNLLTDCRSISVKKKEKKNSLIVLVFVILFFDRALGRFLGHNLFDPIKFY